MSITNRSRRPAPWVGDASSYPLRVLVDELARRRIDPAPLLAQVGLTHRDAYNPLGRVSRAATFAFHDRAVAATGDPAVHLHAGINADIGTFGAADFIATMSPKLGIGIARVAANMELIDSGMHLDVVVGTHEAYLRARPTHDACLHPIEFEILVMATILRVRRATLDRGGASLVTRIGPDPGYGAVFERLAGCPVRFDAAEDRIAFTRAVWDARPATAHPAFAALVSIVVDPIIEAFGKPSSITASVERVVEENLSNVGLCAADVAAILGVSLRTLHRRLAGDGRRFGDIVDEVRLRRAKEELARGTAIVDIALQLGFSETAAFTRAYRRWTGEPPSAHRARATRPDGP
ncbi:MAG: AraC family transcriptional regulator ligand-binding domain-containing protein [Myxococcota bacterium]